MPKRPVPEGPGPETLRVEAPNSAIRRDAASGCGIGALCLSAGGLLLGLFGLAQEPQGFDALPALGLTVIGGTLTVILAFVVSGPRNFGLWTALPGFVAVAVGSGIFRRRITETIIQQGPGLNATTIDRLETWWPLVALGLVLIAGGIASWILSHPTARTILRLSGPFVLLFVTSGMAAITVVMNQVTVFHRDMTGRPIRRGGRRAVYPDSRSYSASGWLAAAYDEAESVVSFVELSRRLVSVGAPNGLVSRCRNAARQEAVHARLCCAIATRDGVEAPHTVKPPAPARAFAPVTGRRSRRAEIVRLGLESFVDGVVGEAYSARRLGRGAETATDVWTRGALHAIQLDETAHARLGSDIVAWCGEQAPRSMMLALRCATAVISGMPHETPAWRTPPESGGVSADDAEALWRETLASIAGRDSAWSRA